MNFTFAYHLCVFVYHECDLRARCNSASWKNPSGDFRLGLKPLFDVCPKDLVARLKTERRKDWDARNNALEVEIHTRMAKLAGDKAQKAERVDCETRLSQLADLQKSYEDVGPFVDCVIFHTGERWQVLLLRDDHPFGAATPVLVRITLVNTSQY